MPYIRLCQHISGRNPRSIRRTTNLQLINDQELAIKTWISLPDDMGVPPTVNITQGSTNSILWQRNPEINLLPIKVKYRYIALKKRLQKGFIRVR